MQTIIWAFCIMISLFLFMSFLPLGFTKKGKLFVAFCGFIISEVGQMADSTFPLWQTVLMLFLLVLFSAFFIHKRLASLLYIENSPQELNIDTALDTDQFSSKIIRNHYEIPVIENQQLLFNEEPVGINPFKLERKHDEHISHVVVKETDFLEDDNIEVNGMEESEYNYLLEIESMLNDEKEMAAKQEISSDDWLGEPDLLSPHSLAEIEASVSIEYDGETNKNDFVLD